MGAPWRDSGGTRAPVPVPTGWMHAAPGGWPGGTRVFMPIQIHRWPVSGWIVATSCGPPVGHCGPLLSRGPAPPWLRITETPSRYIITRGLTARDLGLIVAKPGEEGGYQRGDAQCCREEIAALITAGTAIPVAAPSISFPTHLGYISRGIPLALVYRSLIPSNTRSRVRI